MLQLSDMITKWALYELQFGQKKHYKLPPKRTRYNSKPGVYVLYFLGQCDDPIYGKRNTNAPIYIGKAENSVYRRLKEHSVSIADATNLDVNDFRYKCLAMHEDDFILIPAIETLLIQHHKPLWNLYLKGFGNHKPGRGRKESTLSPWDSVHPGRAIMNELNHYENHSNQPPEPLSGERCRLSADGTNVFGECVPRQSM